MFVCRCLWDFSGLNKPTPLRVIPLTSFDAWAEGVNDALPVCRHEQSVHERIRDRVKRWQPNSWKIVSQNWKTLLQQWMKVFLNEAELSIEFFRTELYRIYRICRILFLAIKCLVFLKIVLYKFCSFCKIQFRKLKWIQWIPGTEKIYKNHSSMNRAQFKDLHCYRCLPHTEVGNFSTAPFSQKKLI